MALESLQVPDDKAFLSFRTQCESEQGWLSKYSKGGIGIWVQPPPPQNSKALAVHKIKGQITIQDLSSETVYDVLHDVDYRKKWDYGMIETHDIARLNANADVGYYSWKCPKPLKNRDVVTLRSWLVLDNYRMILSFSVKHPEYPPRKDLVRAVSLLAGYLITTTGPSSCVLTYLAQVDPKGSLPKWVVNKCSQFLAPKILKKLHKACMRYPAWKQKNKPHFKPWLYPEQNTLPCISLSQLSVQHAASLENIDESGLAEVTDEQGDNSDEDSWDKK
ncbi:START domain-containing protein 10-like [Rhinatrema bivittatum]|uniref:START domain-containing protein 10-like n=1 Tax=Rhinatrema bivittatum TaxID=194408 RepID=UPI001127E3F4|nr:START domain-containing protein 10-like [Rhinatrema bivittatum]XP_029463118.1 START domain-containing protein 10-like [Rhinatrema bivittatum]